MGGSAGFKVSHSCPLEASAAHSSTEARSGQRLAACTPQPEVPASAGGRGFLSANVPTRAFCTWRPASHRVSFVISRLRSNQITSIIRKSKGMGIDNNAAIF